MLTIGLTGGIASGKSLVASLLAHHGAHVIDMDAVAREVYRSGTAAFEAIVAAFGPGVVGEDGEIDRKVLAAIVFADGRQMHILTDIVWPQARAQVKSVIERHRGDSGVLVFETAMLFEAGWQDLFDQVWVVTAPFEIVCARLMARNGMTRQQAESRIKSQTSDEHRSRYATVVIDNGGSVEALTSQVENAWAALLAKSA